DRLDDVFSECDGVDVALHSFPTRRSSDLPGGCWRSPCCLGLPCNRCSRKMAALPRQPARTPCTSSSATKTCSGSRCATGRPSKRDRKSTRLNSSHVKISYAVFCLKKKIMV